jgi:hypothetical protein
MPITRFHGEGRVKPSWTLLRRIYVNVTVDILDSSQKLT